MPGGDDKRNGDKELLHLMALSNSQYDNLMHTYETRRLDNEYRLRRRYEKAYSAIPKLREIDDAISSLSVKKARDLLNGDASALSSLKEDIQKLLQKKYALLRENDFAEDYLEMHYTCEDCQDTGYIGDRKCHCLQRAIIDLLYEQSNLNDVLAAENFSTFSLDYYSPSHINPKTGRSSRESAEAALKVCQDFASNFASGPGNLFLYGDIGVGKTFLSHCVAKELLEKSYSVIYFSASRLFELLSKDMFGRKETSEEDIHSHIYNCDLLIVDDLGSELSNTFTVSQFFTMLNERILRRKPIIMSTNLTPGQIKSLYSERIFSRISSNFTILRLTGDDIRIQKKLLSLGGTNDGAP